ncbi:MAG: hypothetical protein LBI06_04745 [Treponema sp.]|jgi:hypothetical protein|nr:hypothetical protein [Treponema sp.]
MKSSESGLSKSLLSNSPIYTALAVYMPFAVLAALVFLLKGFFSLPPGFLLASGGVGALGASFYYDFMKDAKYSRAAADIRGIFIILIITYIFGIIFERKFLPGLSTILAFVGTFYAWVSVISLKRLFSARARFEAYTESCRGEQLYKALFDDTDLLQFIDAEISNTKRYYIIQFVIIGIVALIRMNYKGHLPPALYVLLIGILASGICIFGFLGIIRQEHYYAAKGLSPSAPERIRRMLRIGLFSALAIGIALLLSSDKSLLPFSLVSGFFGWILKLFAWIAAAFFFLLGMLGHLLFPDDSKSEPELAEVEPFPSFLGQVETNDPWPGWIWVKYGLIAIAVGVFLWFMISPLLKRAMLLPGELPFRKKVARIIKEWFRGMASGLVSVYTFIRNRPVQRKLRGRRPSDEEVQRAAGAILGAYSQAKRREMRQSATLFARLIIWGGEVRQIAWKPVHAPGEYCSLLASADTMFPEKIVLCGELFEKALYSAEVLTDTERKEFKDMVEEITSFADNI